MRIKIPSYATILIGMIVGVLVGFIAIETNLGWIVKEWIAPFGEIFMRLLKLIAVPIVFVSLIKGIGSLGDITKLANIGGKTIITYIVTTIFAISIGITLVSVIKPGALVSNATSLSLAESYKENISGNINNLSQLETQSPLQPIVDMFPDNLFLALSSNGSMLQVIMAAILIGICAIMIGQEKNRAFMDLIESLDTLILKLIDLIMKFAPYGASALMAAMVVNSAGDSSILQALGVYMITVLLGLFTLMFIFYPLIVKLFTKINPIKFIKAVIPVQLVGFATSSSAATLATTMKAANNTLGLPKSITSFTLPIGVTINMDGTSCYQAIGVIFIAQVMNIDLSFVQILTILATTTLASIGTPGVPGGSIVITMMVLTSVGIPAEGIALILGVDRPLDMVRTSVNVTGDVAVSSIISERCKME